MHTQNTAPMPGGLPPTELDFDAIKAKQQATWSSGDFAVIGVTLQMVGESLAEAADVRAGERVLDVAAGNGNATLAAARRFARVTSTDYVPALLEKGKLRAKAEGLSVDFEVADAEALPFEDASFDVVLSTSAPCSPRITDARRRRCYACFAMVVASASRTGRLRASSGSCSR